MAAATGGPAVRAFFDEATNTVTYLAWDPATKRGAVVDPVLDWDNRSGEAGTSSADAVLRAAESEGVALDWVLETHVHADHLTAAPYMKARTGASIGIGERIRDVQTIFRPVFNADDLAPQGGDFDRLFRDGEEFALGSLTAQVMHVPGHTPACVAYHVGNAAFVGDTLFMPDGGSARADFPGGDGGALYDSIQRIFL
ncbi:MAG: MBL fold metallo-hydrolase, partial [Acetobacteraceae bacterium]|nr:MBL fold metallo-hydrolase [Acetobacteraceae bacterium]